MTRWMLCGALLGTTLQGAALPGSAEARQVRLSVGVPAPQEAAGGLSLVIEDGRPDDEGGTEPDRVGTERGSFGIPSAVTCGAADSPDVLELMELWALGWLRAAALEPAVGAGAEPALHMELTRFWSSGYGPAQTFHVDIALSLRAQGAEVWSGAIDADAGLQRVMRFDDPVEAGFARVLDEAGAQLVGLLGQPAVQAHLPGVEVGALAAAIEAEELETAAQNHDSGDPLVPAAEELPAAYRSWDPETYAWGARPLIGAFVGGGIGLGLLIGGDQWARARAASYGVSLAPVMSTMTSAAHVPGTIADPPAVDVVQGYVAELMFVYGVQLVVPSFGAGIPGLISASAGTGLQQQKAISGVLAASTLIPTGIVHLARFGSLWAPGLNLPDEDQRAYYLLPGVVSLASGIVDLAVGSISLVFAILYATERVEARVEDKGIIPHPRSGALSLAPFFSFGEERALGGLQGTF